jgi:hypothetical protein
MTEAEWLACKDPKPMLEFLRSKASDRKLRLMLCGWSRLNWRWLPQQSRSAVAVAELFADGSASDADRRSADAELWWATRGGHITARHWLARLTLEGSLDLWEAAHASASSNPKVKNRQITIFGDVFGNPFRPVTVDPSWLAWNNATVIKMAEAIYNGRTFDRLPILADALEDAGCTNEDMLTHCRQPGEHVRGCWAVDLLTGRD